MTQHPMQSDRGGQPDYLYLDAEWLGDGVDTGVDCWPDNAQVIARPPLVYAIALLTVAALRWIWPLPVFQTGVWDEFADLLLVEGIAVIAWGKLALAAAGTEVNPARPTTTIVDAGPYRYTRNPLYLGLTTGYVALSIWLNSWWAVIVLPVLLAVMHFGVVLREERYLAAKFGDAYRRYRRRVPRYL